MSNPDYDLTVIQGKDIKLLREVAAGQVHYRNGIPDLLRRNLVEPCGLRAVQITGEGHMALRGIMRGAIVQVQEHHHNTGIHGAIGFVDDIATYKTDANGIDQYGYVIPRAKDTTSATVILADRLGQWIFRDPLDLLGFPKLRASVNPYLEYSA